LTLGDHKLLDFIKAILHPTPDTNDGVFADAPMCWYHYTGYANIGNRECRFWVQAVARAFFRAKLVAADPTELFREKDDELGYKDKSIPRGQFFEHRPADLQPSDKGVTEQKELADGFPTWN
jgi:hypothetical protein